MWHLVMIFDDCLQFVTTNDAGIAIKLVFQEWSFYSFQFNGPIFKPLLISSVLGFRLNLPEHLEIRRGLKTGKLVTSDQTIFDSSILVNPLPFTYINT